MRKQERDYELYEGRANREGRWRAGTEDVRVEHLVFGVFLSPPYFRGIYIYIYIIWILGIRVAF